METLSFWFSAVMSGLVLAVGVAVLCFLTSFFVYQMDWPEWTTWAIPGVVVLIVVVWPHGYYVAKELIWGWDYRSLIIGQERISLADRAMLVGVRVFAGALGFVAGHISRERFFGVR